MCTSIREQKVDFSTYVYLLRDSSVHTEVSGSTRHWNWRITLPSIISRQRHLLLRRVENQSDLFKTLLIIMDSTVNNLANLADLSEPAILHETRHRYYNQQIYTHAGSNVLLAVNPHRVLNLYNGKPKPKTCLQICDVAYRPIIAVTY